MLQNIKHTIKGLIHLLESWFLEYIYMNDGQNKEYELDYNTTHEGESWFFSALSWQYDLAFLKLK